jgi:hypothetical protein
MRYATFPHLILALYLQTVRRDSLFFEDSSSAATTSKSPETRHPPLKDGGIRDGGGRRERPSVVLLQADEQCAGAGWPRARRSEPLQHTVSTGGYTPYMSFLELLKLNGYTPFVSRHVIS